MNSEKFKLWKLALSAIHIDGKVTKEEEKWFHEKISVLAENKILNFTPEQIDQLQEVMHSPGLNFLEDFRSLSNPADCSFLVHLLRIISHLDKDFSEEEKSLYQDLEKACLEKVNLNEVEEKIKVMEKESYHEDEVYKVDNPKSLFESFFMKILRSINPGDYKFPD